MKNKSTKIARQLIEKFDEQLIQVLKEDLQLQRARIKNKLIHLSTVTFDKELYQIIKHDICLIKSQLSNQQNNLAQAG
ncbi:hypothetical protein N9R54_00085 [Pelobium sp.]|nr:hypothetical protein [Pelobium sp.]MDA9554605.1 hypothetical protein [Pelobium sp.]